MERTNACASDCEREMVKAPSLTRLAIASSPSFQCDRGSNLPAMVLKLSFPSSCDRKGQLRFTSGLWS